MECGKVGPYGLYDPHGPYGTFVYCLIAFNSIDKGS